VISGVVLAAGTSSRFGSTKQIFVLGSKPPELNAMTIQAYYTWRLATTTGMQLEILKDGADILLAAGAA